MSIPVFRMFAGSTIRAESRLSQSAEVIRSNAPAPVGELQVCSFDIENAEPDHQYLLRIGDLLADPVRDAPPGGHPGLARNFAHSAQWESGIYFDSARGETSLVVLSRSIEGESWRPRAEITVNVVPTKLGEDRYESMYQALARLSLSFVHDLISKSAGRLGVATTQLRTGVQSPQVRLKVILDIWAALAPSLTAIENAPVSVIHRSQSVAYVWGAENLRDKAVNSLAERGFSPSSTSLPLKTRAMVLAESCDTFEHRVLKGFLRILIAHLNDCAEDARANIAALRADAAMLQGFRDAVEWIERRVEKLEKALAEAETTTARIRTIISSPFFGPLRIEPIPKRTPVFENVVPYRRAWNLIDRYSRTASVMVSPDVTQRVKATWKMYEQWVFFQIAGSIQALGFTAEDAIGLLQRKSRYRFTLDLDYGSRLSFANKSGDTIAITYQPLIHGYQEAVARRDTLFRGGSVTAPWSPDVVVEILDRQRSPGRAVRVRHALVVDAKYSKSVVGHHWDQVWRYTEIRATDSRAAIVKQVWIAFPGIRPQITPRDEFVEWTPEGPNTPLDETVLGSISLIPHTADEPIADDPITLEPSPIILEFMRGMLYRFGVKSRDELATA